MRSCDVVLHEYSYSYTYTLHTLCGEGQEGVHHCMVWCSYVLAMHNSVVV